MAQVCQIRDDSSGLHGGRELIQGARLQDIRGAHIRPERPCGNTEDIFGPARQFHQMMTVRHYLTGNPYIEASLELLSLSCGMSRIDKKSFVRAFDEWYVKIRMS